MQGVIDIKGKPYTLIAERVRMAHAERESFEIVESKPIQVGEMWVWQVAILVNGKRFIGTAEIKFDASPKSADGTNPVACAETSACGRALGFANLGVVESIASAEEVIQAIAEQERPQLDPNRPASSQQIDTCHRLQRQLGLDESDFDGLSFGDMADMIKTLNSRLQAAKR